MSINEPITIRSYIDKNLTNLNWNILPQIFESEGVELTEEIERYLRETPKNTNWNILEQLGKGNNLRREVIFTGTIKTIQSSGQSPYAEKRINTNIIPQNLNHLIVTLDTVEYTLPLVLENEYARVYGEINGNNFVFTTYPFSIVAYSDGFSFNTFQSQSCVVTIEYEIET